VRKLRKCETENETIINRGINQTTQLLSNDSFKDFNLADFSSRYLSSQTLAYFIVDLTAAVVFLLTKLLSQNKNDKLHAKT
jgi:hypothetical protein